MWLDERELIIGTPLIQAIADAIHNTDYVIALISSNSVQSSWVQKELNLAMTKEILGKRIIVLPVKVDECETPFYLLDKLYANFTSKKEFHQEAEKLFRTIGVKSAGFSDLVQMYIARDWKTIFMLQTFADRIEQGETYHCTNPYRSLRKVFKVFGNRKHPVDREIAEQCIENAVATILYLDPQVIGLGGVGNTARRIHESLKKAGSQAEIDFWGGDIGIDACKFLAERYGVEYMDIE